MRKTEAEPFQLNKEQLPIDLLGKAPCGVFAEYNCIYSGIEQ